MIQQRDPQNSKNSVPRGRKRNYKPFWTPRFEQLQEAVNKDQRSQAKESFWARWCKQRYAETLGTDRKKNAPGDLQPQLEQSTTVPEIWKAAYLVPVLKKGKNKISPGSHFPISLLSCVGKLVERVITRRLTWYLETNNVFSPSQTGYHQHRSTEDQLEFLFDLSKAFKRVWKKGVQWKLLRTGV